MKAFPTTTQWVNGVSPINFDSGMDLRDYFAAKAMQAFVAKFDTEVVPECEIAQAAYWVAHEMLVVRERRDD